MVDSNSKVATVVATKLVVTVEDNVVRPVTAVVVTDTCLVSLVFSCVPFGC